MIYQLYKINHHTAYKNDLLLIFVINQYSGKLYKYQSVNFDRTNLKIILKLAQLRFAKYLKGSFFVLKLFISFIKKTFKDTV